jgi:C4-dicarboxylate-specific signal transduction histidine kinase
VERQPGSFASNDWRKKLLGGVALCAALTGLAWIASAEYTAQMLHSAYEQQLKQGEQNRARWENTASLQELSERFQFAASNLKADVVWALNSAGECIAASNIGMPQSFIGGNYADRQYFRDTVEGRQGRQYVVGRISRVPGLYFASPVTADGQFVGSVIVKRDLTHFER